MTKIKSWSGYYDAVANRPPRQSLLNALDHWEAVTNNMAGHAVDLGCGSGQDTYELLRRGWQVLAIDQEAEAIRRLILNVPAGTAERLDTQVAPFERLTLPGSQLINASFSLPFCLPEHFDTLWQQIVDSLGSGGIFVGQLFGDRDSWVDMDGMTFHNQDGIYRRFVGFELLEIKEVDEDGSTATGREKHWHYFEVTGRKV